MRQTSIDAYNQIRDGGLLSRLRFSVYETMFKYGPMTMYECHTRHFRDKESASITPRFRELEEREVICEVGQRLNPHSDQMATLYDVTGKVPKKLTRKMPNSKKIKLLEKCVRFMYETARDDVKKEVRNILDGYNA